MKKLEEVRFDSALCRKQLEELRAWLAGKVDLSERNDVLPFFRLRPHLAVLFGMFNLRVGLADRIAWEFDLFGDFACDLIVGQWDAGAYCLVEFEDARSESIFQKQGKKATREWGRRFEHGYSQIVDWAHKLDGRSPSSDFLARFGRHEIHYEAALVIGRSQHLDAGEMQRLNWRADKVSVNAKKIYCTTFDELLSQFSARVGAIPAGGTFVPNTSSPAAVPPAPKTGRKGKP